MVGTATVLFARCHCWQRGEVCRLITMINRSNGIAVRSAHTQFEAFHVRQTMDGSNIICEKMYIICAEQRRAKQIVAIKLHLSAQWSNKRVNTQHYSCHIFSTLCVKALFLHRHQRKKKTKYNNTHAQCACDDDDTHGAHILQKGIISERSYLSFVIPIR